MFPSYKNWCAVSPEKRLECDRDKQMDSFTDHNPASNILDITRQKVHCGQNCSIASNSETQVGESKWLLDVKRNEIGGDRDASIARETSKIQTTNVCKPKSDTKGVSKRNPLSRLKKQSNPKKNKPKCAKCRNHGRITDLAGHKGSCLFAKCNCDNCSLVDERRLLNCQTTELKYKQGKTTAVVRPIPLRGKVFTCILTNSSN